MNKYGMTKEEHNKLTIFWRTLTFFVFVFFVGAEKNSRTYFDHNLFHLLGQPQIYDKISSSTYSTMTTACLLVVLLVAATTINALPPSSNAINLQKSINDAIQQEATHFHISSNEYHFNSKSLLIGTVSSCV